MTKKSDGDWLKEDDLDSGNEFGEDWESAFQAEDFEFSPDEDKNNLFEEGAGGANPYEFTPPAEHELAGLPDLDGKSEKQASTEAGETGGPARQNRLFAILGRCFRKIKDRFTALPLIHKFVAGGTSLLLLTLLLAIILPTLISKSGQIAEPPPLAPLRPPATALPEIILQPEPILQRWQLEPFVLPIAAGEATEKLYFLEVQLTLLLALAPDGELPLDRKFFLRDLIYQYYQSQPYENLRRFALARGEMNRALLTRLREQWPEAPIETIIFNRYQIR